MSASYLQNRPSDFRCPHRSSISRIATANAFVLLLWLTVADQMTGAQATQSNQNPPANLKQLSLEELGSVEVTTASKEPEQVWRTPAAIYVLTQEDIRRSGATSIPEALRLVPGLHVARINSSQWAISSRGFNDIDRIEVIRGPGATIWGANAVNGVINIVTKTSAQTQGGLLSASGGNQELGSGEARYGSKIGSRGHY